MQFIIQLSINLHYMTWALLVFRKKYKYLSNSRFKALSFPHQQNNFNHIQLYHLYFKAKQTSIQSLHLFFLSLIQNDQNH